MQLKDDAAGTNRDRLYLFIGRPQSWDNENSPPQAVDSFSEFSDSYDDMISMKRVLASDTFKLFVELTGFLQNKPLVVWVLLMTCIVMIILLLKLLPLVLPNYMILTFML